MLVYFFELSKIKKSTTLWNTYSMLKCTLGSFHKVNIGEYKRLIRFLKKKEVGFRKKKSKEFTAAEITEFLNTSSDKEFLVEKVQICGLTIDNVIDTGSKFVVTIQHVVKKIPVRRFSIEDDFYTLVKKYVSLRPVPKSPGQKMSNRFFLNYQKSKCTRQAIGINKIGGTPKRIAQFLKLSDANEYTGHCFRRTTEKLLKDVNVDMRSLSRYGEWKS
ncbi:GSCOCG00009914001-RA-CDS, partial [Cotesia congregata]